MRTVIPMVILSVLLLIQGCQSENPVSPGSINRASMNRPDTLGGPRRKPVKAVPIEISPEMQEIGKGNTAFAFDLYQELKGRKGNLFLSPYSISTALAMTYAGARGRTEQEMAEVLHFPDQAKLHPDLSEVQSTLNSIQANGFIDLNIANSLWLQQGFPFSNEFTSLNKKHYKSELKQADFARSPKKAAKDINTWVRDKTKNRIREIVDSNSLSHDIKLVLCNAIYFKALWAHRFFENNTKKAPFHLSPKRSIKVRMMNQRAKYCCKDFGNFSMLEMRYTSTGKSWGTKGDPSMIIILPKEIDGLPELEKDLSGSNVDEWIRELRKPPYPEVAVSIPKFKTSSEFELTGPLVNMGMPNAFSPKADFSGMTGAKGLFIGQVAHKAFIDVNEEGTEAAAATAVLMGLGMKPRPKHQTIFIADHPFIFLIRDNASGSILFIGRITNPTK